MTTMNDAEREAFEQAWHAGVFPDSFFSDRQPGMWAAFKAGAAWQRAQGAGVAEQIEGLCASMNIIDTLQRPGMSLRDLEAVNAEKNVLANKVRILIARYAAAQAPAREDVREVPDVSAMAKVLSDRVASACCVDPDDNWKIYGQEYIEDVRAMLARAPAHPAERQEQGEVQRLREALEKAIASLDQLLPYLGKVPADIGLLNDALISGRAALAAQGVGK